MFEVELKCIRMIHFCDSVRPQYTRSATEFREVNVRSAATRISFVCALGSTNFAIMQLYVCWVIPDVHLLQLFMRGVSSLASYRQLRSPWSFFAETKFGMSSFSFAV